MNILIIPRQILSHLAMVLALLLGLVGCAKIERAYEAVLVLADIAAGEEPSRFKATTPPPARKEITYRVGERGYVADIYHPGLVPRAGMVLAHGIAEQGKDDPRLRAFAETLARARFTVLVPDIQSFRTLELHAEDAQDIADAVTFLTGHPEWAPNGGMGIGAFSYGVGPAILAALQPDIRHQVSFIVGVGGYYDLMDAIAFLTTGYYRVDDEWRYIEPEPRGKWVVLLTQLDQIEDPGERERLERIAELKLEDLDADVAHIVEELGPEGRAVYEFLTNTDPERVPELIAGLPEHVVEEIQALNLANEDLARLEARLLLVHGRDDHIIPYIHSVNLAGAVPEKQAELFLLEGLFHVDIDPGLKDGWRLWRATKALLRMRDSAIE